MPFKLSHHTPKPGVPVRRRLPLTKAQTGPDRISSRRQAEQTSASQQPSRLLLCDFDKTIADFDAGESTGLFWSQHQIMWAYILCAKLHSSMLSQLPILILNVLLLPGVAAPEACAQARICDQCQKAAAIEAYTAAVVNVSAYAGLYITN